MLRHAFAELRRVEEAVDEFFVGFRSVVGEEGVDFIDGGRETGQIEGEAADECDLVGFGRGIEAFLFEARQNEFVDFVASPFFFLHFGRAGLFDFLVSPGPLPFGAFFDPLLQCVDLDGSQFLAAFGGRHVIVFIGGDDALDDGAFVGVAGDDGVFSGFENFKSILFNVEAQASLAMIFVWPMALVTILGEDWADIAIVLDGGGARTEKASRTQQHQTEKEKEMAGNFGHVSSFLLAQNEASGK